MTSRRILERLRTVLIGALILAAPGFAQPRGKQGGTDWDTPWLLGCALVPGTRVAWIASMDSNDFAVVYRSTDWGSHWCKGSLSTNHYIYDIFFLDSLNGWTCGTIAEVWHTTDGGDTWQWQGFGCSYYATRIVFTDPTHGWMACGEGVMGRWDDSSQAWLQVLMPYPDFLPDSTDFQGVSFVDTLHGWMCAGMHTSVYETIPGGQGYIAYTYNNCDSWVCQVHDTINDYYGIKFTDLNHGVVVGGNDQTEQGYIGRTTDGGQTWTAQNIPPTTAFLRNVAFPDARHGWAVGQQGTIVHTSDGGQTWAMQNSGTDSILYDVNFTDSLHGLVSGGHVVLFTSDGGNTWTISPVAVAESKIPSSPPSPALSLTATPSLFYWSTTLNYMLPGDPKLARLEIRDITGRLVRTFAIPHSAFRTPHCLAWDGTDNDGQRLPSGCYFCTLRVGTQTAATKLLLMR